MRHKQWVLAHDPGASRDPESLRGAEGARFLPRTCQEHKPVPGELWPCSQPRPSSQFLILPPRPTCIYPTPSPLATTPSSWDAWRAHLPKHHLTCVHLWGASLSSPASLPLPAFLIVKSQAHLDARPLENRAWTPHPPVQPPDPHKWPCMWEVIGKCLLKPSSSPEHPLLTHVHTCILLYVHMHTNVHTRAHTICSPGFLAPRVTPCSLTFHHLDIFVT